MPAGDDKAKRSGQWSLALLGADVVANNDHLVPAGDWLIRSTSPRPGRGDQTRIRFKDALFISPFGVTAFGLGACRAVRLRAPVRRLARSQWRTSHAAS